MARDRLNSRVERNVPLETLRLFDVVARENHVTVTARRQLSFRQKYSVIITAEPGALFDYDQFLRSVNQAKGRR